MRELPLRHAVALGLLHGPTELLPISSSGHTTLVPWLAGWPYGEIAAESRKSFEVALHAGTAAALLLDPPAASLDFKASFLGPALFPPVLVGYALGERIERRLGTPGTIALGLLAGSVAMIVGEIGGRDSSPARRPDFRDGLGLGFAQALALIPGVSRSGATLAVARARGFSRTDADRLSWNVGLPVIAGATMLKGSRLAREMRSARGRPDAHVEPSPALMAGAAGAFFSTLLSSRALSARRRARLIPLCVAYRGALAAVVIRRMRDNTS